MAFSVDIPLRTVDVMDTVMGGTAVAAPPPFRHGDAALCRSCPQLPHIIVD